MGEPGEDRRGFFILFVGDNALGHPSTHKRAPRVSLWQGCGGERERAEGEPGKSSTPVYGPQL